MNLFLLVLVLTLTKANAKPAANSEERNKNQVVITAEPIIENTKDLVALDTAAFNYKDLTGDEHMIRNDAVREDWYKGKNDAMSAFYNFVKSDDKKKEKKSKIISEEILEVNSHIKGENNIVDGDIMPLLNEVKGNAKRNAVRDRKLLWHSKTIPYQIDNNLNDAAKTAIRDAIRDFHDNTCIKFEEHDGSSPYFVKFISGKGCYSYMGDVRGNTDRNKNVMDTFQPISIGPGCEKKGTVIHECMHMLGFYHEQSRYDRDKYIKVYWNRIPERYRSQYRKATVDRQDTLGEPYDYDGVMHYARTFHGRVVMEAINDPGRELGQKKGFSKIDIKQINKLYDCNSNSKEGEWSSWSDMSPCLPTGIQIKQRFCYHKNAKKCVDDQTVGVKTVNGTQTYTTKKGCPAVNGGWSSWSPWDYCSESCGDGTQQRDRTCNNPAPIYGGKDCQGNPTETKACVIKPCPVDGHWSKWSDWGPCSVKCGGGNSFRTRECNNPMPQSGGTFCSGNSGTTKRCNIENCKSPKPHTQSPIKITKVPIKVTTVPVQPMTDLLSCSFENGKCGWYYDQASDLVWKRSNKGPIGDHTTEKGYFMYIDSTNGVSKESAMLYSTGMDSNGKSRCFEIFYYMYGSHMGFLTINVVPYDSTTKKQTLISLKGNQGNSWKQAAVTLDIPKGTFFDMEINGTLGHHSGSNIAIDDIRLWEGPCPKLKFPTPSILNCGFETGLCNWYQAHNDKYDWTRNKGKTPSYDTGPLHSATGPNDYYMFIEASSPIKLGDNAVLRSPVVASQVPSCMEFKYSMNGSYVGDLIIREINAVTGEDKVIWKRSQHQGDLWLTAKVNLPPNHGMEIEIEGIRGRAFTSDIAIDEIKVNPRKC